MDRAYDLVIRGGRVIDGTGGEGLRGRRRGQGRPSSPPSAPISGQGARGDRRPRPAGHPRLRRHPHPLRRPGHLGRPDAAVVLARRHHGGDGQLRRRLRALRARRPRPADPADGRRRGHSLPGADRGPAVELGELSGLSGRPGAAPLRRGHRRPAAARGGAGACDGRARRQPRAGHPRRHRRHGRHRQAGDGGRRAGLFHLPHPQPPHQAPASRRRP